MNWLFMLVWLTLSSCTFVDAKLWGHKEEAEATVGGAAAHMKEKMCEAADKACHDKHEAESRMAHAAHTVKDKLDEAVHHIKGEGHKEKAEAAGIAATAAAALHHAKEKVADAKDSAVGSTKHAGEKAKHAAEDAWDSATSNVMSAAAKASEAGDFVKGKVRGLTEPKPVHFMHPHIPGFHSWLAIFMAIFAQMGVGWAWYGLFFRKPFLKALQEDRMAGGYQSFSAMPGVSDKLYQAGLHMKDSAMAAKFSDAAHQLSNTAAAQKLSHTGELLKDKVAAGTASISQAAANVKDKAEAAALQAKEKMTHAAHSAQESAQAAANQASEKASQAAQSMKDSAMGQKISHAAQGATDAALDAKAKLTAKVTPESTMATTTTTYADVAAGRQEYTAGPYSAMWGPIASLFSSIIRSFFMFHWMKVLLIHNNWGALAMATFFFLGSQFCSMHHYIWEGRPLKLMLIDQGCEFALSATTAFIIYHWGMAK